jgi:SOUL heme-binding protein
MRTAFYYMVLVLESILGVFGIRMYEEPPYQIIDHLDHGIEVRRYGPRLAAEVDQPRDGEAGAGSAFRLLFNYIAGANMTADEANVKIPMTAPVAVHTPSKISMTMPVRRSETNEHLRMLFFMPSSLNQVTAPRPTDARVKLIMVPVETVAVLRFSGAPDRSDRVHEAELMEALATSRWQPASSPYMLFYDPPFTIPALRRNEAAVEVDKRNEGSPR